MVRTNRKRNKEISDVISAESLSDWKQQNIRREQEAMLSGIKRLLTEAEKEVIYEAFRKNNNLKNYLKWFVMVMFPMSLMSIMFGIVYSVIVGFVCVVVGCIVTVSIFVWGDKTMKKLISQIETDELYVREAIFKGINKYHQATFYVKKNGKLELCFKRVDIKNRIALGDKVILIERGEVDWVYKACE